LDAMLGLWRRASLVADGRVDLRGRAAGGGADRLKPH